MRDNASCLQERVDKELDNLAGRLIEMIRVTRNSVETILGAPDNDSLSASTSSDIILNSAFDDLWGKINASISGAQYTLKYIIHDVLSGRPDPQVQALKDEIMRIKDLTFRVGDLI